MHRTINSMQRTINTYLTPKVAMSEIGNKEVFKCVAYVKVCKAICKDTRYTGHVAFFVSKLKHPNLSTGC